ncbi:MAG: hypothetical protein ACJASF_001452 [Vicingaceae bacterium]
MIPLLQYSFNLVQENELSGEYKKEQVKVPVLSLNNLSDGSFQNSFDRYWQNEHGFRNWLIRLNNQLNYSVFDKANANGTIVCKENVLITEGDIKSYLGYDFAGKAKIDLMLDQAQFISDTLQKRGIPFVFMVAPSKASVYKDQIPSKYFSIYNSSITNYDYFMQGVSERNLKVFDTKKIILEDEHYFEHLVFPKNGVHWSGNTVAKISDTLVEYLANELSLEVPKIQLKSGELTIVDYRFTDYDIGEAMNLLWNVSDDILHYPEMSFINVKKKKPNLLGVGDSFIQSFYGFYPVLDSVFSQSSNLWYYNKTVGWPKSLTKYQIKTQELDLEIELEKRDLIVLEMTEENLKLTGYGFVEDLYNHFTGKNRITAEKQPLYEKLSADLEIKNRAKEIGPVLGYAIPQMENSLIRSKLKNEWLINFDYEAEVKKVIIAIKTTPKWMAQVKEKAIRRNEPLEKTLRDDAIWVVNKKLGN